MLPVNHQGDAAIHARGGRGLIVRHLIGHVEPVALPDIRQRDGPGHRGPVDHHADLVLRDAVRPHALEHLARVPQPNRLRQDVHHDTVRRQQAGIGRVVEGQAQIHHHPLAHPPRHAQDLLHLQRRHRGASLYRGRRQQGAHAALVLDEDALHQRLVHLRDARQEVAHVMQVLEVQGHVNGGRAEIGIDEEDALTRHPAQ